MESPNSVSDFESTMRRLQRDIDRSAAEERMYHEMLKICENQINLIRQRNHRDYKEIKKWKEEYRRLARDQQRDAVVDPEPVGDIRELDREADDLAVLASVLTRFLLVEEHVASKSVQVEALADEKENPLLTAEESDDADQNENYTKFLIVDEKGQPLGIPAKTDSVIEEQKPKDTVDYIEMMSPVSSLGTRSPSVKAVSPPPAMEEDNDDTMRTVQQIDDRDIGEMRSAIEQRPIEGGYHDLDIDRDWDNISGVTDESGRTIQKKYDIPINVNRNTPVNSEWQLLPAYSTLNEQNEFIFVPVLSFEKEKENPTTARVALNEVQQLWQHELDASSGQFFIYTVLAKNDDEHREMVTHEAILVTAETKDGVSRNVQRSLLHRVLVSPRPKMI